MNLVIQKEIFETFDRPIIGAIFTRGLNNQKDSIDIGNMLRNIEAETRDTFSKLESHGQHPNIIAWRQAYKKFGSDPHQYRCSAEALVRRVLKGDTVPYINSLVDLYNYISLKYLVPVGGEDMDAIRGDLHLAFADSTESFVRLGGTENEPADVGEVVYKDHEGIVCRRWNWREADRTKLTKDTRNAVVVIDALSPMNRATVEQATNELANLIKKYCGGETRLEFFAR